GDVNILTASPPSAPNVAAAPGTPLGDSSDRRFGERRVGSSSDLGRVDTTPERARCEVVVLDGARAVWDVQGAGNVSKAVFTERLALEPKQ
ncbi:MAG TPA: hypothetical protein VE127_11635, partial [Solirubrobacteraceae bacterium]|nr:hypothetical protein [Solirubrobacteraceae bacterium]